ncbi:MAG: hypothetical protein Q8P11_03545 [bacterium]|nr:hypothetical protein [bacterium]
MEKFETIPTETFVSPELSDGVKEILDKHDLVYTIQRIPIDDKEHGTENMRTLVHIPLEEKLPIELPKGYGIAGGVARNVALRLLGNKVLKPRDVDIVVITDINAHPNPAVIDMLEQRYMSNDSAQGHGIRKESLSEYFLSRDFVLNEVLILDEEIIATPEAINDLKNKIIRPTEYKGNWWYSYSKGEQGLRSKLVMKALRLQVEFEAMYGNGTIDGIKDWQWEFDHVRLFDLAIAVDKSYEMGDELAERFYNKLLELGIVTTDETKEGILAHHKDDLVAQIIYWMEDRDDPFYFKNAPTLDPSTISDNTLYEKYRKLAKTYTGSRFKEFEREI